MRHIFSTLLVLSLCSVAVFAQQHKQQPPCDPMSEEWQQRIKKEQVAFITSELDLTAEEAQQFWPVFNAVEKAKQSTFKECMTTFKALEDLLAKKNVKDSELLEALDAYLQAKAKTNQADINAVTLYRAVISPEKIAKLFILQENFRREMLMRLGGCRGGHGPAHNPPCPAPPCE